MDYFFLDASALGKRYVPEIGTPLINHLFRMVSRDRMTALILGLGEVLSILVRSRNGGRLSEQAFRQAMADLRAEIIDTDDFRLQTISDELVRASLPLIERHALNATDAIICVLHCGWPKRFDQQVMRWFSSLQMLA